MAGQLSPRGTCLAFAGKDKIFHKINGEVYFKENMPLESRDRGLDALGLSMVVCMLVFCMANYFHVLARAVQSGVELCSCVQIN